MVDRVWTDTISAVLKEVEIDDFPESCPWVVTEILESTWLPSDH